MPSGYPRNLCANTRIRLLATQSFPFLPSRSNSVLTYSRRWTLSHKWTLTLVKEKIFLLFSLPIKQTRSYSLVLSAKKFVLICKNLKNLIPTFDKAVVGISILKSSFLRGKAGESRLFDINKSPTLFVLSLYGRNGHNFPSCFFL